MSNILSEDIQGRRQWLQHHINGIERRLRRMVEGKLRRAGWYDADDILSSARRRLDIMVFKGELPVRDERQLNALISKIAKRVAIDKYRMARRLCRLEQIVGQSAELLVQSSSSGEAPGLGRIIPTLCDEDQRLLSLWMDGVSQKDIANELGISLEAYRTRRKRLIARLRGWVDPTNRVRE